MSDRVLSGRRVLVVEDEMMVLMAIQHMLADLGCESVTAAATAANAIELVASQVFDIAMLDVNLNGHESYAVADALAALGVPFVFSTGYNRDSVSENYRNRPVLRKPYQPRAMANVLSSLL